VLKFLMLVAVVFGVHVFAVQIASAQDSATPAPSATPSTPSDPCGSILSIVTRPTITTSTCTVRGGHELLETGYSNTTLTGIGGGSDVSYPQAFVRVGIANHAELDITPPSFQVASLGGMKSSGWSDMGLGAKWELGYSSNAVWGVNFAITAPTGSSGFTASLPQYTGNFNWGYTLNSTFSLSGTLGFNALAGPSALNKPQQYFAFIPTLLVTGAVGSRSQLFAEYSYFSCAGPGLGSKSILDFGYQYDIGPHVQLDAEYGLQPTLINAQRQHYVGAGLSFMT
jgi:hypothetical protein